MTTTDLHRRVAAILAESRSALFITGAGISADSGLPTYRGIGGLYDRAVTEEGIAIEEALSGRMMRTNPAVCWKYIHQIEEACRGASHNRGHEVIAQLEQRLERVVVLTQNVDGFHLSAGSRNVIAIHGDVHDLDCTSCDHKETVEDFSELEVPPDCPTCGGLIRPRVVLFGEMLHQTTVLALHRELARGFDVVFSIGTTSVFPYIAAPVVEGHRHGIPTVEINPGQSEVSHLVEHRLVEGAASALDAIWSALTGEQEAG